MALQKLSLNRKRTGVAILAVIVAAFLAVFSATAEVNGTHLAFLGIGVALIAISILVVAVEHYGKRRRSGNDATHQPT